MAMFLIITLFTILYSAHVSANLYVIDPPTRRVCHGGQPCTISWLDDGKAPLLDAIKICYVTLYNGDQRLIQEIDPVDVSTTRSLTFTPSPGAGPNSDTYYVNFTSVDPVDNKPYHEYSSFFIIDNMTGSFDSPVPSLTAPIPIPSSLLTPPSTSTPPPSSTPTPSGMSTSRISPTASPSSSKSFSGPSSPPTSAPSGQNSALNVLPRYSKSIVTVISMVFLALLELR
ncbi:hypothetical protein BDM02DRAFT_3107682 [Thelephora ganbajun]|uniref:Uncharacterized protein n=1 Tax=Thelephora ganbajun TaxID=370292 RepID=A0ACB6ZV53_THEGA|nr:hypothetical protein BDM02DRAFT_3107682 [Thelephora ganbajun]